MRGGTLAANLRRDRWWQAWPLKRVSSKRSSTSLIIAHPSSREASLFLRIAATPPADDGWAAPVGDSLPVDWDRLTAFALLENAVTLLDDRVSRVPEGFVPAEKRDRIGRLALIWTFKLKLLERRLDDSLRALSRAGIEVILLKGAALVATTYRSFTERPMADIDLLVDASRAREAHDLMQKTGWVLDSTGYPADAWDNHHHLPPLSDTSGSGLRLEIHVAPIPPGHPFKLDFPYVASSARSVFLGGIRVRVPEMHVHAVHSAIHFAWSHHFESGGMNAFRDLAAIASSNRFSWIRFVDIAKQTRSTSCCYWTLRLAKSLARLDVPDEVLTQLEPPINDLFLSLLEEHFSQVILRSERACPSVTFRRRLWAFALQTHSSVKEESLQWDVEVRTQAPQRLRLIRRVGSHFHRVRQWTHYINSLIVAAAG
jgi:hypothetical protein